MKLQKKKCLPEFKQFKIPLSKLIKNQITNQANKNHKMENT